MTSIIPLPDMEVVAGLLSGIAGRAVQLSKAPPLDLKTRTPKVYGIYRDTATDIICVSVLDLPFAACAGGAMLVFPLCTVNDAIRTGTLEEGMLDTVREILNVCARIFNDHAHQVFQQLCLTASELPADAAAVVRSPAQRLDMEGSIAGYGSGHMTVLVGHGVATAGSIPPQTDKAGLGAEDLARR
jgi:hypothetical protein